MTRLRSRPRRRAGPPRSGDRYAGSVCAAPCRLSDFDGSWPPSTLAERLRDLRRDRVGDLDDGLGVVGDDDLEDPAEELPGGLARLDGRLGRLLEHRVDEAMARADRREDPCLERSEEHTSE